MEMSPLIFMLPGLRSPISQHEASYGNAGRDFHAQHARNLHIPFADLLLGAAKNLQDDVETTLEKI